ncbi:hypothetical protein BDF14DRAFT_1732339 [Spinellus fusiger]|nr:hypothetical protein BDF14DRAFT_1732339 [Spinellus fusiger]
MGAQVDATITAVLGVVLAVFYAMAGLAASVAYNKRHPDTYIENPIGATANILFLFFGIFGAQMLRQVYPKFHFFSLQFMIVQIFSMTRGTSFLEVPFDLPMNYGIPLIIGAGISLVVNLLVWPETAVDGLGRALKETITSSKEMLHMITKQFFLDPEAEMVSSETVDALAAKMRAGMTKVKTAYREAKYEISYSYIRPRELLKLRKSMDYLTKHLSILGGCLKSERQLFETTAFDGGDQCFTESECEEDTWLHYDSSTKQGSSVRRSRSDMEATLRKAASFAASDYAATGKYQSPRASCANSRANSRANSVDEDYSEQNQKSVTSILSFMYIPRIGSPKIRPPKKSKYYVENSSRQVLMNYLDSLRDPLMLLSVECADVLECICETIQTEMDIENDTDALISKNWLSYLRLLLKISSQDQTSASTSASQKRPMSQPCDCADILKNALIDFDRAEKERMDMLYEHYQKQINCDVLTAGIQEELFLVFFFIFTLREVATELESMAKQMDLLRKNSQERMRNGKRRKHIYLPQLNQKWWNKWANWGGHQSTKDKGGYSTKNLNYYMPRNEKKNDAEEEYRLTTIQANSTGARSMTRRESVITKVLSHTGSNSSATMNHTKTRNNLFRAPTLSAHSEESQKDLQSKETETRTSMKDLESLESKSTKEKTPLSLRIRYNIWLTFQYMKRFEFKSSLKMAVAVLVLCFPAFLPSSAVWYQSFRGQWASMTVIAIMNPTSGGTLQASVWRIVGTLTGALVGWGVLEAHSGSPYFLALFAVILAIPFFYIHLASTYNKVGIVVLISYLVVALSRYANPDITEPIKETVWMVWPFIARHATRKSISLVIHELGDYYAYLMGTFLYHDPLVPPSEEDIRQSQKMESKIQSSIDSCSMLLELTDHEPRLKGPFPKEFYKEMLISIRNILDRIMSIRIALTKMPEVVKHSICKKDTHYHRHHMYASLLLYFYTLSVSLRSKTPLPVYMPALNSSREKLMKNRQEDHAGERWVKLSNLTWFATACSTDEIISELEYLKNLIQFIVGEGKYADRTRRIENFRGEAEEWD